LVTCVREADLVVQLDEREDVGADLAAEHWKNPHTNAHDTVVSWCPPAGGTRRRRVRVNIQASCFKLVCIATFSLVVANCRGSSTAPSPSLPPARLFSVCGDVTAAGVGALLQANLEVRDGLNARRNGETDAAGQYCLRDLTPDTFILRASKTGYDDVDQRVTLNGDVTLRFTMAKTSVPRYTVCGKIRESASATPVAGVQVEIRNGTNVGQNTTTDGAGGYCLPALQADSFTVRASKTLYDTLDRTITLVSDATLDFGLLVTTPTITIGSNGAVSPSAIVIAVGQRVTFVNAHSVGHRMESNPHPAHTDCPELAGVGFLSPGQSRASDIFNRAVTCGYHDHDDAGNSRLHGGIEVR
jgi:Carboxypeptidase regulatory-like domain